MKFVGRISREGDKRRMVIIPRRLHDDIETLEGLDLLITLKPIVVDDDPRPEAAEKELSIHDNEYYQKFVKPAARSAAAILSPSDYEGEIADLLQKGLIRVDIYEENGEKKIRYVPT